MIDIPVQRVPPPPALPCGDLRVNGQTISAKEIMAEAQHHPADDAQAALRAAARALVARELLAQRACAVGLLPADPGSMTSGIAADDEPGGRSLPAPDRGSRRREALDQAIECLVGREIVIDPVTPEDARAFHGSHPDLFTAPDLFEARHILVTHGDGDEDSRSAARQRARAICDELAHAPHRFAELARNESSCSSGKTGGRLGQITPGSTAPEFEAALRRMAVGSVSREPVPSRFGYHVIALDHRAIGGALPFEAIPARVRYALQARRWAHAVAAYIAGLAQEACIEGIDPALLATVIAAAGPQSSQGIGPGADRDGQRF